MPITIIPTLRISDINVARDFYIKGLGFEVDWVWRAAEGAPAFAQVSCDGARIYLTERNEGTTGALVLLYVENVDAWHMQLLARNIPVDTVPHDESWGNREMQIRDPDGNILRLCTPLSGIR
jgi:uncharacterized glyoxalase superfamily protein PhnB